MTSARPGYADIFTGLTTLTLDFDDIRYELEIDWEVSADTLDYKLHSLKAWIDDEFVLSIGPAEILNDRYWSPRSVVRKYDKLIRSKLWDEIGSSTPSIGENRLVN